MKDGQWTFRDTVNKVFLQALTTTQALDDAFVGLAQVTSQRTGEGSQGVYHIDKLEEVDTAQEVTQAARLWTAFRNGYIAWHIQCPRYRLKPLQKHFDNALQE